MGGIIGVPLFFFPVPAVVAVVLGVLGHRKARDLGGEIIAVIAATLGVVVLMLFGVVLIRSLSARLGRGAVAGSH